MSNIYIINENCSQKWIFENSAVLLKGEFHKKIYQILNHNTQLKNVHNFVCCVPRVVIWVSTSIIKSLVF